jgi:hypothetical protein
MIESHRGVREPKSATAQRGIGVINEGRLLGFVRVAEAPTMPLQEF